MELYPIIQISVIIFGIVSAVIITASYVMYKVKQKTGTAGVIKHRDPVQVAIIQHHTQELQPAYVKKEQHSQSSIRKRLTMRPEKKSVRPKDRFLIVNQQQNNMRHLVVVEEKPFYHPRAGESQRQMKSRKAFNLFENYSDSGEKLHKLNLSPNFS